MTEPLITVVTPTWGRNQLLFERCIPSVQAQTYPNIEHLIISDGPDPELGEKLAGSPGVRFVELPEHDPTSRWGEYARIHAEQIATGDLLAPVDDDDSIRPCHLDLLAAALQATGADFAYGKVQVNTPAGSGWVGQDPPCYGQITVSWLYRRALREIATWRVGQQTIDWDLAQRWIEGGARWVFVDEVTADIYPSLYWPDR